jgi:hypothetical protein
MSLRGATLQKSHEGFVRVGLRHAMQINAGVDLHATATNGFGVVGIDVARERNNRLVCARFNNRLGHSDRCIQQSWLSWTAAAHPSVGPSPFAKGELRRELNAGVA